MADIKYPNKYFLGTNITNPRIYFSKLKEVIDRVNDLSDGTISTTTLTLSGAFTQTDTTESSLSTTGAIVTAGGIGVAKNITTGQSVVSSRTNAENHTGVAINSTAAGTLTVVKAGLLAGLITSTSAAGVTVTLDSVANIITAFTAAGVRLAAGSRIEFLVDNSAGANTVTVAVDSGATIAVATPAITGGATLTVSTSNKIGLFSLYLTSATAGILSRVI